MIKDEENKALPPVVAEGVVSDGAESVRQSDREKPVLSDAEQRRRERAAVKLRENLARRKQQSRARRAGEAEDGNGLPAARIAMAEPVTPEESDPE